MMVITAVVYNYKYTNNCCYRAKRVSGIFFVLPFASTNGKTSYGSDVPQSSSKSFSSRLRNSTTSSKSFAYSLKVPGWLGFFCLLVRK